MRTLLVLTAVLNLATPATAAEPGGAALATLNGFRDVACGSTPKTGMRLSDGPQDLGKTYVRATDDLTLGDGGTLASLEYSYLGGKFTFVMAQTTGISATNAASTALLAAFGPPTLIDGTNMTWTGTHVSVGLAVMPASSGRAMLSWTCMGVR